MVTSPEFSSPGKRTKQPPAVSGAVTESVEPTFLMKKVVGSNENVS